MNKIKDFIFKKEVGQMEYDLSLESAVQIIEALILKSNKSFSEFDLDLKMLSNKYSYRLTSGYTLYLNAYKAKMDFDLLESDNKTLVRYEIANTQLTKINLILSPIIFILILLYSFFSKNELLEFIGIITIVIIGFLFFLAMNRLNRGVVFDRYKRFIEKEFLKNTRSKNKT